MVNPGPLPTHLQSQSGCQHAAGSEADGEAEEEQDSPAQELHHEHLEGKGGRKLRKLWGLPPASQGRGAPWQCSQSWPSCHPGSYPRSHTPLLKGQL